MNLSLEYEEAEELIRSVEARMEYVDLMLETCGPMDNEHWLKCKEISADLREQLWERLDEMKQENLAGDI